MVKAHLEAALLVGLLAGVVPTLAGRPRGACIVHAIHRHLQKCGSPYITLPHAPAGYPAISPLTKTVSAMGLLFTVCRVSTQAVRACHAGVEETQGVWKRLTNGDTWLSLGSGVTGLLAFCSMRAAPFWCTGDSGGGASPCRASELSGLWTDCALHS